MNTSTTKKPDKPTDLREHILAVLREKGPKMLDELVHHCPAATWNRVFLEVDKLSRSSDVHLAPGRGGRYEVRLPGGSCHQPTTKEVEALTT